MELAITKRPGGQLAEDGNWLVLTESIIFEEGGEVKGWIHNPCGEMVMNFIDYRPIWDGPFLCSGSGRVRRESVPYCPKLEEKPVGQGPIDLRVAIWGDLVEKAADET